MTRLTFIWSVFIVVLVVLPNLCHSWNVLFANSFAVGSHQTVSSYVANLLALNNHSVTYVSSNVPSNLNRSINIINLKEIAELLYERIDGPNGIKKGGQNNKPGIYDLLTEFAVNKDACQMFYDNPEVQELLNSGESFDLFSTFAFDICSLGIAHQLGIKVLTINAPATAARPFYTDQLSLSSANVKISGMIINGLLENSMLARAKNVIKRTVFGFVYEVFVTLYIDPIVKAFVPSFPGCKAMADKVQLALIHHHPLVGQPVPYGPSVVSVGGMMCPDYDLKDLSEDIRSFLEDATGFVVFSLGSLVGKVNEKQQTIFRDAFSRLPYKVIWKTSSEVRDLPANVMTTAWLPQSVLLMHPKMRVFITHGGHASIIEAFCSGVPMVFVPVFAEGQFAAADYYESIGLSSQLSLAESTSDEIVEKVLRVDKNGAREKMRDYQRQMLLTRVTPQQLLGYLDIAISGIKLKIDRLWWYEYLYFDLILLPVFIFVIMWSCKHFLTRQLQFS